MAPRSQWRGFLKFSLVSVPVKAYSATTGGGASNSKAKRVQSGNEKPGNLERGGAALAPPEMRDGYKGFTEDVSKSGAKPKDK